VPAIFISNAIWCI